MLNSHVCLYRKKWKFTMDSRLFPRYKDTTFLKLIDNSSSLNKGNHDRDSVWISVWFFISVDFYDFMSPYSLVLVLIEKTYIYQTFKTVSDHISKHLLSLMFIKNTLLCVILYFLVSSQCLEMWSNTVFCKSDISCSAFKRTQHPPELRWVFCWKSAGLFKNYPERNCDLSLKNIPNG